MSSTREPAKAKFSTLADRPSLYLIYLVFLFLPWAFMPFGAIDLIAALVAVAIFLPLHYLGFNAPEQRRLWTIAATVGLGMATAPFAVGHSVFHIYAVASAGFIRPVRTSAMVFVLCTGAYLAAALLAERQLFEIGMALLLGTIIWVSCFTSAEGIYEQARTERAHALDLQQASLVERERIARDLHDLLGHTLTLVSLKTDLVGRLLEKTSGQSPQASDLERAREELDGLQRASREALADVRAALSGLTATSVEAELLNARVALEAAGVQLQVSGLRPSLTAEQDTAFGLMLREAVTNIIRHSSATQASISFAGEDDVHSLQVTDNGNASSLQEGSGLSGLRARLEDLGGMLSISHGPGVQLRALLPQ